MTVAHFSVADMALDCFGAMALADDISGSSHCRYPPGSIRGIGKSIMADSYSR
jgi:hypothetical protein